jgi:hypothetical protein
LPINFKSTKATKETIYVHIHMYIYPVGYVT